MGDYTLKCGDYSRPMRAAKFFTIIGGFDLMDSSIFNPCDREGDLIKLE
jgi:hypothetical protein